MMRALRTLACACLFGGVAMPSVAAHPEDKLSGVVRDAVGRVVPNVMIMVTGGPLLTTRSVLTNERGEYALAELPPGRYVLTATLDGFEPRVIDIDVRAGAVPLNVMLDFSRVEHVTVTATKTGVAEIQTTPIALTSLPAGTLEQLGVQTLEALAGFVPTLTIAQYTGLAQVTIRGIGTNLVLPGTDPSSTIHLDGVYLARPSMAFMDFLDVDRVEVLRGPQGTLYGRNSVGGTINIVTRQPTNAVETAARITAGNYARLRAEGAVSGPVIKNRLMGSFAFLRGVRDGFVKDLDHPDRSLGSEDTWAGRAQLRVMLGPRAELLMSADHGRFNGVPLTFAKAIAAKPGFSFDNPASLWEVRTSHPTSGHNIQQGGSAKVVIQMNETTTLNSLTAYRKSNHRFVIDADLTELPLQANDVRDFQHQFSHELTIVRRAPALTWVGGAFFFDEHDRGPVLIRQFVPGIENRPDSTLDARAWALFGEATYRLTQRLSLTGGLRYTDEQKDLHNTGGVYVLGSPLLANPSSFYAFVDRATYDAWTPKVSIQARATTDTFVYASATRGFKSGGFNPSWPAPDRPYRPEFAWSFEGGLKHTMAGGRIRVNTAVFYSDHRDLQVQSFIRQGLFDVTNAASAVVRGVEAEVSARGRRVQLSGHVSWLDATYRPYIAVGAGGRTLDADGNRLNNAPEWSGSGSVVHQFASLGQWAASIRADASWQSRVFFTPFNDAIEGQSAYGLLQMRINVGPRHRRWEVAVYARNLGRSQYITATAPFSLAAFGGRPGEPRHWGTQLVLRR